MHRFGTKIERGIDRCVGVSIVFTWRFPSHAGSIRLSSDPKSRLKHVYLEEWADWSDSYWWCSRRYISNEPIRLPNIPCNLRVRAWVREGKSIEWTTFLYRWWQISMHNNRPDAINRRDHSYYRSPRCVLEESAETCRSSSVDVP